MSVALGADLREIFRNLPAGRQNRKRIERRTTVRGGCGAMLPRSLWAMARSSTSFTPAGLVGLESHLLERVDAAVLACDLDGRILFANRYAEELYGWPRDEIVGRLASDFFGVALEAGTAEQIMKALAAGGSWEGTFDVRRKDSTQFCVHAVDSPLYDAAG